MIANIKNKKNVILVFSIIIFFLMLLPYLYIATYASPSADDFSNLSSTLRQNNVSFWGKAISQSINTYKAWQGTFTGNFVTFMGGYIYYKFGVFGLHIEYICNICLFFIAIWSVTLNITKMFSTNKLETLTFTFITATLVLFIALYDFDVSEVFYWHTGLAMYTLPLSLSLFQISIIIKKEIKRREIIAASILGFIAAGGSLDISAFACGVSLLFALHKILKMKKIDYTIIIFVITLTGAVINVAAPGNYVRHAAFSEEFPIWSSLMYSYTGVCKAVWKYVGNGTIYFIILLCTLLFNKLKEAQIVYINPVLLAILLFIGAVIIDFPVYLGYSGSSLPLRCEFVRRVTLTIFMFAVSFDTMGWFAKKSINNIHFSAEIHIMFVIVSFIALNSCVPSGSWGNVKPFKIYNDICFNSIDHRLSRYEEVNNTTLEILKNGSGQDIVINVPGYDSLGYLKELGLTSNPNDWVNVAIADYFGNNSIVFTVEQ